MGGKTTILPALFLHNGASLVLTVERVKGIEPSSQAWEAHVLPLNHTRFETGYSFSRCFGLTQAARACSRNRLGPPKVLSQFVQQQFQPNAEPRPIRFERQLRDASSKDF